MPMTSWGVIYGKECSNCQKPASHYYGGIPLCCQCHGGGLFSAEETAEEHERIKLEVENASKGDN